MYFYFISFLAIFISLKARNKMVGLRISLFLLFLLLGFQYELVQDWEPNIGRWMYANLHADIWEAGTGGREIEPFFMYLLQLFKPITFFGWLMLTAVLFLSLLYYLMRLYVPPKYYWVTLFLFMMRTEFALLFINSNRQCWSLMFVIIGVLILLEQIPFIEKLSKKWYLKYAISVVFVFAGTQCHSAAYAAFLIYPLYLISIIYTGKRWILIAIICNIIYLGKSFINISSIQPHLLTLSEYLSIDKVSAYIELIGENEVNNSLYENICYCLIITLLTYYYRKFDSHLRFMVVIWFAGLLLFNYLPGNTSRMAEYLYYYLLLIMPNLVLLTRLEKGKFWDLFRPAFYFILIFYGIWTSWNSLHMEFYERWMDYKSVFDAPIWI